MTVPVPPAAVTGCPPPRAVPAGDRVLGARVSFEGASPEAVGRLLEGAGGCRVSLYLRRRSPGATGTPGATATPEGQRDGVARLVRDRGALWMGGPVGLGWIWGPYG